MLWRLMVVNVVAVSLFCVHATEIFAASNSPLKSNGYCCSGSKLVQASPGECTKKKGNYYQSLVDAKAQCGPTVLAPVSHKKPALKGYCCTEGNVLKATGETCAKARGTFFPLLQEAEKSCNMNGYCCRSGEVVKSRKAECGKRGEAFFLRKNQADKTCARTKGYCCIAGEVQATVKEDCEKNDGIFALRKGDADRKCFNLKGYCCLDGKTQNQTAGRCRKMGGTFFFSEKEAVAQCAHEQGFCCDQGLVSRTSRKNCETRKATFSTNKTKINRYCKKSADSLDPDRPVRYQLQRASSSTGTVHHTELPDLQIKKTWLDMQCIMHIEAVNKGGSVATDDFLAARVHISAGPGTAMEKPKSYLKTLDPAGRLKQPGGSISYNTGLTIQGKQTAIVRLDTSQSIKESNERNNGDTPELMCPKPLIAAPGRLVTAFAEDSPPARKTEPGSGSRPLRQQRGQTGLASATLDISALPARSGMSSLLRFGFTHPTQEEIFTTGTPVFSWRPHPRAVTYYIRVMETGDGGSGSHRTIWSKGGITGTSIRFNNDGSALESLVPSGFYRVNLYARAEGQTSVPDNDPSDYLAMTGDVSFKVATFSGLRKQVGIQRPGGGNPAEAGEPRSPRLDVDRIVDPVKATASSRILARGGLELGRPDLDVFLASPASKLRPMEIIELAIKGYEYSRGMYIAAVNFHLGDDLISSLTSSSDLPSLGRLSTTIPFTLPMMLADSDQYYFSVIIGGLPENRGIWGNTAPISITGVSMEPSERNDVSVSGIGEGHGHGLRIIEPGLRDRFSAGNRIHVRFEVNSSEMMVPPPQYYEINLLERTAEGLRYVAPLASRLSGTECELTLPSSKPVNQSAGQPTNNPHGT